MTTTSEELTSRTFRAKLERLLTLMLSQGEVSRNIRQSPREVLAKLGFTDREMAALRNVSFDVVATPRRSLLTTGVPSSIPTDPVTQITVVAAEPVTIGGFVINFDLAEPD